LCGDINLETIGYEIRLDPSGLYLGILTNEEISSEDNYKYEESKKIKHQSMISYDKSSYMRSENKSETKSNLINQRNNAIKSSFSEAKSSILVYEVGTGNFVFSLGNIFRISNFKFSNDGNYNIIINNY